MESIGEVSVLDSVTFHFDEDIISPLRSSGNYQYLPEKGQLAYLNTYPGSFDPGNDQSIKFFDFESGRVANTLRLDKGGGHGFVVIPTNFYYQTEDSIWVYPARVSLDYTEGFNYCELRLVNSRGQVEMRPSLASEGLRRGMAMPMSRQYGAIVKRGRNVVISSVINWGQRKLASPFYKLDSKNARSEVLEFKPYRAVSISSSLKSLLSSFKSLSEVRSVLNNKGDIVSNFPLDHRLSIIDEEGDVESKEVRSQYLGDLSVLNSVFEEEDSMRAALKNTGFYIGLLYDEANALYYRIVRLPRSSPQAEVTYTLMVINSEFELIAESKFSGAQYLFEKGVFVAQGGVFVLLDSALEKTMSFAKLGFLKSERDKGIVLN